MKTNFSKIQFARLIPSLLLVFAFSSLLSISSALSAQNSSDVNYSDIENEWKLYQEKNGVQVYYKKAERNDEANGIFKEVILLKLVNTTNTKFEIQWKAENWYDGKCWNCDKDTKEQISSLVLDAGESQEGIAERDTEYPQLRIFSRFLNYDDKPELTKFRFVNFEVNPSY